MSQTIEDLKKKLDSLKAQLLHTDAKNARIRLKQDIDDIQRQIRLLEVKSNESGEQHE